MSQPDEATKKCTKCGETKPLDGFHRDNNSKDGRGFWCKACANARARAWHRANAERSRASSRQWHHANIEKSRAARKKWHVENKERAAAVGRRNALRREYGLSLEAYDALVAFQEGACSVCGNVPTSQRLVVDHNHACCPGKRSCGGCIRGLLCSHCNRQLGWFEKHREAILAYLERTTPGGNRESTAIDA